MQVGDRVRIRPGTQFADQNSGIGTVTDEERLDWMPGQFRQKINWCDVRFDNGYSNSYPCSHLIVLMRSDNGYSMCSDAPIPGNWKGKYYI